MTDLTDDQDLRVEVSWWKQGVQAAVFDADERGAVIGGE